MKALELVEDRLLAEAVDDQRPVASLTHPLELRARLDAAVLGEDPLLPVHRTAAGRYPVLGGDHAARLAGWFALPAAWSRRRRRGALA